MTILQLCGRPSFRRDLRILVNLIRQDRGILHPIHRGHALVGRRVLHVFDAVARQHRAPMGLGVRVILLQALVIGRNGLVELVLPPEVVCPVEQVQLLLVRYLRKGHRAAAVLTGPIGLILGENDVAAAHLAFDDRHTLIPL